jgi:hypothetical protein
MQNTAGKTFSKQLHWVMNPSSLQPLSFVAASSCFLQDPHSLNKKLQLL